MIRFALLWLYVGGVACYAFKDWYRALCGLILLMAVVEHPDMPKNMLGIQGLNPWNILLLVVLLAWALQRSAERLEWDMPRPVTILFVLYMGLLVFSTVRLFLDPTGLEDQTPGYMVGEYLINTFKWIVPGLLLFTGCRSRDRLVWGTSATLGLYVLLGLLVIRWMPPSAVVTGSELAARSLKVLVREVGYHRVNLSMMLAGASWAILAARPLFKRAVWPVGGFLVMAYAEALTGGRAGYVTWAAVGLVLCMVRWRKYLLLVPATALVVTFAAPGVAERMSQGFTAESSDSSRAVAAQGDADAPDDYTITAGRTFAWSFVIQKIQAGPIVGFGRQAMIRTGLTKYLWTQYQESFPHPHNAYLETLLDNGIIGFALVLPFYLMVLGRSLALFRDSRACELIAVGGITAALVLALLVASFGSQTFYPREGAVGMWCAIGLMWRVSVQRAYATKTAKGMPSDIWLVSAGAIPQGLLVRPISAFRPPVWTASRYSSAPAKSPGLPRVPQL